MNTLTRENRDDARAQAEQFVAPPASVVEAGDGYTGWTFRSRTMSSRLSVGVRFPLWRER